MYVYGKRKPYLNLRIQWGGKEWMKVLNALFMQISSTTEDFWGTYLTNYEKWFLIFFCGIIFLKIIFTAQVATC